MKCKHCNFKFEKNLDPQGEFCDKCYLQLNEAPKEIIMNIDLHINVQHASLKEIIQYIEDFCNYTRYIQSYNIINKKAK